MRPLYASLLLLLAAAAPARPQRDGGSLGGFVTDPSGSAVQSARIAAEQTATGRRVEVESSAEGGYSFAQLPPGEYRVRAAAEGFETAEAFPVVIEVGSPRRLDFRLTVGRMEQTVTVSADGPGLNLTDATMGVHIGGDQIVQLPLEGRNVLALLTLQPGTVHVRDSNVITRTNFGEADADARNGAVNGGRSDQANVTLDGIDANDQQTGFALNSALRVGAESVAEFRVVVAGANADAGRSSGAQISLVTRSGSNEFHGALFHAHRNTVTSANSFFSNRAGIDRAKLVRNTFGGALGGPVVRDRLFFFGSFEGRRDASETTVIRNVPTQLFRDGNIRYRNRAGEVVTLSPDDVRRIDPRGIGANPGTIELMRRYPLPNDTPNIDPLNFAGYRFNSPLGDRLNGGTARLDYLAAASQRLFLRGNLQSDTGRAALQFPNTPAPFLNRNTSKGLAVGHDWTPSASLLNSFRYGYTLNKIEEIGTTTDPLFSFGGGVGAPVPLTYSRGRIAPTHHLVNDVSWNKARHTWRSGLNFRFVTNDRYNVEPNRALYVTQVSRLANRGAEILPADIASPNDDFVRAAIMILGVVSQGNTPANYDQNGNLIPPGTPLRRNFATNEYEGYVQDSWRVRSNLTLTLGLRYSVNSPVRETNGLAALPTIPVGDWFEMRRRAGEEGRPSTDVPALGYDLSRRSGAGFTDWDRNNFAPRLAAAWSPAPGWAVRAGFGVHYDRIGSASIPLYDSLGSFGLNSTQINPVGAFNISTAPRFETLASSYPSLAQPTPPFAFPIERPRVQPGQVGVIVPAPDTTMRTPYSMLANISVQREFGRAWLVEAAYVNRTSRNLLTMFDSAAPLNLRDTASGMTYFEAVERLAAAGTVSAQTVQPIAFWENMFPALRTTAGAFGQRFSAFNQRNPGLAPETPISPTQAAYFLFRQANLGNDLAALRNLDVTCNPTCSRLGRYAFYNDQFASLFSWRSLAPASYDAMQLTLRRRLGAGLTLDANYTLSRSEDWTSGAERGDAFGGAFVINSWAPEQMRARSDFDLRHQFNSNWVARLPFGRGQRFGGGASRSLDALIGGWQFAGVMRWTSGFPVSVAAGTGRATNHYQGGYGVLDGPAPAEATNKNAPGGPNLFADPAGAAAAYVAPFAGQTGDRNSVRGDGLFSLDFGLGKSWTMPWSENHGIALRWEVFNAFNSVSFDVRSANLTVGQAGFGTYSAQLVNPRAMQFLLRYSF